MIGDQPRNAGMMEYNGIGKVRISSHHIETASAQGKIYLDTIVISGLRQVWSRQCREINSHSERSARQQKVSAKIGVRAIITMIFRYRENAQRISKMLARKPYSSKEQLVKHVEFVAEFGECHIWFWLKMSIQIFPGPSKALRPQSLDMTFIEYNNLDLLAVCFIIIAIGLYVTKELSIIIFGKLTNKLKSKKDWSQLLCMFTPSYCKCNVIKA